MFKLDLKKAEEPEIKFEYMKRVLKMEIWGTLSPTKKALEKCAPRKGTEELLGGRRLW